jgi:hypothetical protein
LLISVFYQTGFCSRLLLLEGMMGNSNQAARGKKFTCTYGSTKMNWVRASHLTSQSSQSSRELFLD